MEIGISGIEFRLFKSLIDEKCGIEIPDEKAYLIESRLTKILVDLKLNSFSELYNRIRNSNDEVLTTKLINAITTNETLWFRDQTPWKIIEELYLPKYIQQLRSGEKTKIRIWSAATSTGQEAYSTAMCIDNYLTTRGITDVSPSQFEIIGTDISGLVLEVARRGRYDNISIMRGLDKYYKNKYFKKEDNAWELTDEIKSMVNFTQYNLQNSFIFFGKFDIIFCRYVLIYFSKHLKDDIVNRLDLSLKNEGILFVGAYEIHEAMNQLFKMEHFENGTYYTKHLGKETDHEIIVHR